MPTIYIAKEIYDELVKLGEEPSLWVSEAAKEKLELLKKGVNLSSNPGKS